MSKKEIAVVMLGGMLVVFSWWASLEIISWYHQRLHSQMELPTPPTTQEETPQGDVE